MDWQLDWDLQGRLPLELELVTAQGAYGDEIKQIFWIVPKVNPQTVIRNTGQQGGGVQGGGEQGGGNIEIPGGNIQLPNGGQGGGGGGGGGQGGSPQ